MNKPASDSTVNPSFKKLWSSFVTLPDGIEGTVLVFIEPEKNPNKFYQKIHYTCTCHKNSFKV